MSIYTRSSNVKKFIGPESIKRFYYDYILILNNNDGMVKYYGFNEWYKTVGVYDIEKKDSLQYYFDIEHYDCFILIKMLFNNKIEVM